MISAEQVADSKFKIRKGLPFKNNEIGLQLSDPQPTP